MLEIKSIIFDSYAYFEKGGIIMIPLLLLSLIAWSLIIERLFYFKGELISAPKVYLSYRNNGEHEINSEYKNTFIFNIIKSLYSFKTTNKETQLRLLNEKILVIKPKINKNLMTISVLTAIAPLLGLLGTVFGIVTTFDIISAVGSANARSLASGISEALITTKTGLIIAIPGYFFSNKLNKRAERIMKELYSLNHLIHEVKI